MPGYVPYFFRFFNWRDDVINGTNRSEIFLTGRGNDFVFGGGGSDIIISGTGNDTVDGGNGDDLVLAGAGNDTLIHTLTGSQGWLPDVYDGGRGFDTLRLNLTAAQWADPALQAELVAWLDAIEGASPPRGFVRLESLNLLIRGVEALELFVDGVLVDPRDPGGPGSVTAVDDSFAVDENGTLFDSVAGNDTAPAGAVFSLLSGVGQGLLVFDANGGFSFDTDGAFDDLALGETATQSFTYEVSSGGDTATATATITITGSNDAPTVSAALTAATAEDASALTLDLLSGASDVDNGAILSVTNLAGLPVWATLSGTELLVDPGHPDLQGLALGDEVTVTVTYDITDEHGASVPQTATLTITGTNDAPVVAGAVSASGAEDSAVVTVNLLDGASDVDSGAVLSVINVGGLPAWATLSGDSLTIDPSDPALQKLNVGQDMVVTITYDITDEHGATVPQTATLTITGTNDAPTVAAALSATAAEDDAAFTVDLLDGASDVDTGAVLSVINVSGLPAWATLSGNSVTVDPGHPDLQALADGDVLVATVTFDITDEHGATVPQTLTLTITGTDDSITVAGPLSAAADEDDPGFVLDLLDGASNGLAPLSVANVTGLPSWATLSGNSVTVDPGHPDLQSLALGDDLVVTIAYDITDGLGGSVPQTATLTITGTNDTPTVAAALSATAAEDDAAFTVDLLSGASDVDTGAVLSVINVSGLPAWATLSGDSLTVDPGHPDLQGLNLGDTATATVTYDITDEHGATVPQTATLTITGTNDTPTVAAALSATAAEDSAVFTLDLLSGASDVDLGATLSIQAVLGLGGGMSVSGTTLTVDPSASTYQSLAVGESRDITVTYEVVDEHGAAVPQTAVITITGTNDAPTVAGALTAGVTEDAAPTTVDLLLTASDIDTGAVLSVQNVTGLGDGITLSGTSVIIDPGHPAYQGLNQGDTLDVVIGYDIVDEYGASVPQTLTVTIFGTDGTIIVTGPLSASAAEDDAGFTVDLLTGASESDGGMTLSVANVTGLPTWATLSGDTVTVDPGHPDLQSLALGQTVLVTISYDIVDGGGSSVPQTLSLTITGTNDTPTVAAALSATAAEDDAAFTLDLLSGASDVDSGAVLSVINASGLPSWASLSGDSLTVDPGHPDLQGLNLGDTATATVTYDITDEHGATVPQTATLTITGTNDTPTVAAALSATAAEDDAAFTLDLLAGASDVDTGAVLSVINVAGLPAWASLSGDSLTVDPGHLDLQGLNLGDTATATVTYDITDEHGATVPQTATLTITGTNDTPTVAAALSATAAEDDAAFTLDLLAGASDVDSGAVLSVINLDPLPAGVTLSGDSLTVDTADPVFQALDDGDSLAFTLTYGITDEHGATVPQSVTITVTGANDAPVVSGSVTGVTNEDAAPLTADLLQFASDVDTGEVLVIQNLVQTGGRAVPFSVLEGDITIDPSVFQDLALGESETVTFTYDVSDGDISVPALATFVIEGRNDAPEVTQELDVQIATGGTAFSYALPAGLFTDVDASDTLTLSADADGGLPSWLSFDSGTGTFTGTPPAGAGLVFITVTATDPHGATAQSTFWLAHGDAVITGTPGEDSLAGTNGLAEVLIGLESNDLMVGEDSSDIYVIRPGDGIDVVRDDGFQDTDRVLLDGLAFADATLRRVSEGSTDLAIWAGGELVAIIENTLNGANSNQIELLAFGDGTVLTMDEVRAILTGADSTSGNDRIFGFDDPDTLEGGAGDDLLVGEDGSDTYIFRAGDGWDVVADSGFQDADSMVFEGINSTGVSFSTDPGNRETLIIEYGSGDRVTVQNTLSNSNADTIESFVFTGDGVTLTPADIRAILLTQDATSGDDSIVGWNSTADTITSGAGNDLLRGEDGSDTYVFNPGDGQDRVIDDGFQDNDVVVFTGYSLADATITRLPGEGNSVVIRFASGDEVTLVDAFDSNNGNGIEQVIFQGSGVDEVLTGLDIRNLIYAQESTPGNDVIVGIGGSDTLEGGLGDDFLQGADGSDTYLFTAGDGRDRISDGGFGDTDVLVLSGYNFADAAFYWQANAPDNLVIVLPGGDEITIIGATSNSGTIEQLVFDDGMVNITVALSAATGATAPWDIFGGTTGADTISGDGGWDILSGDNGNDVFEIDVGDGRVEIDENGSGDNDSVVFTGYALADATFSRVAGDGDDLMITFAGGDEVLIRNGLLNSFTDAIEGGVTFTDATLTMADIRALLVAEQQTTGDDVVTGFALADTIDGGLGDDLLIGGDGADRYNYTAGDGADRIHDQGGGDNDVLVITGYTIADLTVRAVQGAASTVILDFGGGDVIEIVDTLTGSFKNTIETISLLDDGTVLSAFDLRNLLIDNQTTAGDDIVTGLSGSENIAGGLGDDTLIGGDGSDAYFYDLGDGRDVIDDNGAGDIDTLTINGIASTAATFERLATDQSSFIIGFSDGGSITITNSLNDNFGDRIEQITFSDDGVALDMNDVRTLLLTQETTAGDDEIIGFTTNDVITGGLGDDTLSGLNGNDTFVFAIGDGDDIVQDNGSGDNDSLSFVGRDSADATFSALTPGSDDLLIEFANGDSVLVIDGVSSSFANGIELFSFDDVTLTHGDVLALI